MNNRRDVNPLFAAFKAGENKGLKHYYELHKDVLGRYILKWTERTDVAEDILQEIFLVLHRKRALIKKENKLLKFLYGTAKLMCKAYLRELKIRREREKGWAYHQETDTRGSIDDARKELLLLKLAEERERMPTKRKEIVEMRFDRNMSTNEIADEKGISGQTVLNTLSQAASQLKEKLTPKK